MDDRGVGIQDSTVRIQKRGAGPPGQDFPQCGKPMSRDLASRGPRSGERPQGAEGSEIGGFRQD